MCGLNQNIVPSKRSLYFVRSRFTRDFLLHPEPSAIKYFLKNDSYQIRSIVFSSNGFGWNLGCYFQPNGQFPFSNYAKQTINCLVTRVNENEPSTKRFTRAHPWKPELSSTVKYFSKIKFTSVWMFFKARDLHSTLENEIPIQWTVPIWE